MLQGRVFLFFITVHIALGNLSFKKPPSLPDLHLPEATEVRKGRAVYDSTGIAGAATNLPPSSTFKSAEDFTENPKMVKLSQPANTQELPEGHQQWNDQSGYETPSSVGSRFSFNHFLDDEQKPSSPKFRDINAGIEKDSAFHEENLKHPFGVLSQLFKRFWFWLVGKVRSMVETRKLEKQFSLPPEKKTYFTDAISPWNVLDASKLQSEARTLKHKIIEDFTTHPLFQDLDESSSKHISDILTRLEHNDVPKSWGSLNDEFSTAGIANAVTQMLKQSLTTKETPDSIDIFNLQIMKYLGYFNSNALIYFKSILFGGKRENDVPLIWRNLIVSEQAFQRTQRMTAYPGRYNGFLEQMHVEWSEKRERRILVWELANVTQKPPTGLTRKDEKCLRKILSEFSGLLFTTEWPLKNEGMYKSQKPPKKSKKMQPATARLIRRCQNFLEKYSHVAPQINMSSKDPAKLVYLVLNHIYVHSFSDLKTQFQLENLIKHNIYVQKSIYSHVLLMQDYSPKEAGSMKLLNDLNFLSSLSPGMRKYLEDVSDQDIEESLARDSFKSDGITHNFDADLSTRGRKDANIPDFIGIVENLNKRIQSQALEDIIKLLKELEARHLLEEDEAIHNFAGKSNSPPLSERDFLDIEGVVEVVLKSLKNLIPLKTPNSQEKVEAYLLVLDGLVLKNSHAWRVAREKLLKDPDLQNYLKGSSSQRWEHSWSHKKIDGVDRSQKFLSKMRFLVQMQKEINEYQKRLMLILNVDSLVRTELQERKITRKSADEIFDFLFHIRQVWLEVRWTTLKGAAYGAHLRDIATLSLDLVREHSFGKLSLQVHKGLAHLMAQMVEHDSTGQLFRMYNLAFQDTGDYRTYAFFTRPLPTIAKAWEHYPKHSEGLAKLLEDALYAIVHEATISSTDDLF